jgi:sulfite reductase (NADPH) hemoprotein beta-component
VLVGGGLGRTPMLAQVVRDFLPQADLLPYVEAILGAYNVKGRRDNKYKARVKITVFENGLENFKAAVEERFERLKGQWSGVDQEILRGIEAQFAPPAFRNAPVDDFEAFRRRTGCSGPGRTRTSSRTGWTATPLSRSLSRSTGRRRGMPRRSRCA